MTEEPRFHDLRHVRLATEIKKKSTFQQKRVRVISSWLSPQSTQLVVYPPKLVGASPIIWIQDIKIEIK